MLEFLGLNFDPGQIGRSEGSVLSPPVQRQRLVGLAGSQRPQDHQTRHQVLNLFHVIVSQSDHRKQKNRPIPIDDGIVMGLSDFCGSWGAMLLERRSPMRLIETTIYSALFLTLAAGAQAQEKKLSKKDIPAPVLAAFHKAYPKATIRAAAEEKKDGKITFEIESLDGKTARDLQYEADGTVVEIEETIAITEIPEAAKAAVTGKHPKGKIVKAEKVTKGSEVSYDIEIKTRKGKVSMDMDASGKVLKESKEKDKEK